MSDYDDEEAHRNRRPDKTYASPCLSSFGGAPVRIARKVIDGQGGYYYTKEKGEAVRKDAPPSRFELVAKFLENDRGVTSVTIQKFINRGQGVLHPLPGREGPQLHEIILSCLTKYPSARLNCC